MEKYEVKHDINYQSKLFLNTIDQLAKLIDQESELINISFYGNLDKHISRPFAWKLFLKILKPNSSKLFDISTLVVQQMQLNTEYTNKLKLITSKKKFQRDPLAHPQDIEWKSFYHEKEIKKILKLDIMRTYQGTKLFQDESISKILENVLLIWSFENPDTSYKQGMNEIAAVIICGLYPYYVNNFNSTITSLAEANECINSKHIKELYSFFHNATHMECDVYHIFKAMMDQGLKSFYENGEINSGVSYKIYELFALEWNTEHLIEDPKLSQRTESLIKKKLKLINQELYNHFILIGLNCSIFLQRWLRCLFNREFEIGDVLCIWDAILAYRNDMEFVDYISLAILNSLHYSLIDKNQEDSFQLIFDYIKYNKRNISHILLDAVDIKNYFVKKTNLPKDFITKNSKIVCLSNNDLYSEIKREMAIAKKNEEKETAKPPTYISSVLNSFDSILKVSPLQQISNSRRSSAKHNDINDTIGANTKTQSTNESIEKIEEIRSIIGKYTNYMSKEDIIKINHDVIYLKEQLIKFHS